MIPSAFLKDQHFSTYASHFGANAARQNILSNMIGMDFIEHQKALGRAQANIQANTSIDSLLHVHRRKLQRRAANRKSAQLSRARKKAHLEELTQENARLQQLVDVLDSQPELMFCINAKGDITYISERTVNFVNVSSTNGGNDEEPNHISQILSKESVESVLKTIHEIMKVSPPKSALAESSMLFSSKVVEFQDSFGNPLIGYMRCARVNRRTAQDEVPDDLTIEPATPLTAVHAKKAKLKHEVDEQELRQLYATATSGRTPTGMQVSNLGMEEWNLTNFKMLTDCVSNLADRHDQTLREGRLERSGSKDSATGQSSAAVEAYAAAMAASAPAADPEADSEFVCVIRTSDSYFARYSTRSDLYMFVSTPLSAASMEAHDLKSSRHHGRQAATQGTSTSSSSSGAQDATSAPSHSNSNDTSKSSQQKDRKRGISPLQPKANGSSSSGSLSADSSDKGGAGAGEQKSSTSGGSRKTSEGGSDDNRGEPFP